MRLLYPSGHARQPASRTLRCLLLLVPIHAAALLWLAALAPAAVFVLKNGLEIEGRPGKIDSVAENPLAPSTSGGPVDVKRIVFVDDGLRRIFVPSAQVQDVRESEPVGQERIKISQWVARSGHRIGAVGSIIRVTPFDEWGRRIFSMNSARGRVDVIQGITEITPIWTKIEGLTSHGVAPFIWDMRIATSSIPRPILSKILLQYINKTSADDRLKIVRLYLQSQRYGDARSELEGVLKDFPELHELQKELKSLRQLQAQRLVREIELRRDAGQHLLVLKMASNFPHEGVAGETLLKVRELLDKYAASEEQGQRVLKLLNTHLSQIEDADLKKRIAPILAEIAAELNINTLDRFADYLRLSEDDKFPVEQKLSLAISGSLLGSGVGTENLSVSLSLVEVRGLVRRYLTTTRPHERTDILQQLQSSEGGTPSYIAKILVHIKPPVETAPPSGSIPRLYELTVTGLTGDTDFTYHLQLPPEYDPYRRYPAIVTLHGAGTTPGQQIDWWAGAYNKEKKMRLGQASRHGYIVIAPAWTSQHQRKYEYSAREHAAVLVSLRDAVRRFSIDTDRVFLSGHSLGGDAVWDIGLAHPDLWAGVIPIVAVADKYVARYWENARQVSFYFITGEKDGDKMSRNGRDLDRYLRKPGFDSMVVEYLGRGHEHFHDEIQQLFEWMGLHRREFFPREFRCASMRQWDNYFWWVELGRLPARSTVSPYNWPPAKGKRPVMTEAKIYPNNSISLKTGAGQATMWLAPELVDLNRRVKIRVNGKSQPGQVKPSTEVLLEDVRTRGDRLHPFWAKVKLETGRGRK